MSNKTADEMFEELRYKKIHNNDCWLDYKREWCGRIKIISFEINERYIFIQNENATSMPMSLKELQAINKRVKELGWLDE